VEPFQLFGVQHIVALLLVALASALAFKAGRSRFSDLLNRLGAVFFVIYGTALWWYKLADGLDLEYDLPLQLCDLIYLICLACFFAPRPILVTLATYWGLGGTVQALLTPDVSQAFPSAEFSIFFVGHSAIIVAIFFLLGRAPHKDLAGWEGLKTAFLYLLGYVVLAGAFNKLMQVNYGYLSAKPQGASVLDVMGPWPVYVLAGLGLALVLFAITAGALKLLPLEPRVKSE
jgi:hypothetical integral membrane protein (TIGR02206 family)